MGSSAGVHSNTGVRGGNDLSPQEPLAVLMPETIWLIWVRNDEYGDMELLAAKRTEEGAKQWCNESRKLENGDPIIWKQTPQGHYGESRNIKIDIGKEIWKCTRYYILEPMTLGD